MTPSDPGRISATYAVASDGEPHSSCSDDDASATSQMLASAGREIRDSVDSILLMTARARDLNSTDEQHVHLDAIESSAGALITIVNDLHDLADIEIGQLELERVPFSLRKVLGDAMRTVAPQAAAKGTQVSGDIHGDLDDMLVGDPGRLREVTIRLIRHVIEASDRGHVQIRVSGVGSLVSSVTLRFDIEDTLMDGDPSSEPDPERAYANARHSLGTVVVTELVTAMGGRLWVDDTPHQVGAHFTVEVGGHELPKPDSSNKWEVSSSNLPVLVVSDSLDDRRALVSTLSAFEMAPIAMAYPYMTHTQPYATDGSRITPRAAVIHVSDDPFAVCEAFLRQTDHQIPVLVVVSSGRRGDAMRCRQLGVSGYLAMPIAYGDLADAVKATIGLAENGGSSVLVTRHWLSEGRCSLQILVAEDSAVHRRLLSNVLESWSHAVTTVENGAEAVEAVRNASFDVVFMDLQMPVMDGLEATTLIRLGERDAHIPIVAMSAYAKQADRDRCLAAGMDDYLAKPWRPEELAAIVENATARTVSISSP